MSTSIVVTSRNDGYGGHLNFRAQAALNIMIRHYDEVVYVDWCSPSGVSLIRELDLFMWSPVREAKLKHIVVTPDDLRALGKEDLINIPMVEVLGRNIGIRRATGDWIVSSNIDIMPSGLPAELDAEILYTCRRYNVPVDFFLNAPQTLFEHCLINKESFVHMPYRDDGYSVVQCCGDYQAAHRDLWYKMRGFEEAMVLRDCADSNLMKKGVIYGNGTDVIDRDIFHLDHSGHGDGTGGVSSFNSWDEWVVNFDETRNGDGWGFVDYDFFEETYE